MYENITLYVHLTCHNGYMYMFKQVSLLTFVCAQVNPFKMALYKIYYLVAYAKNITTENA